MSQLNSGMSATAGPITAAMSGASGNFTGGLAPVKTPKMQPLTNMNPTSVINNLTSYQNQANDANAQRYGQALGVMGQGQDSANSLYNQARSDISNIGNQQLGRIQTNLQNQLGSVSQNAVNRGLNNSTIADTMTYMPQRQAADAQQGVAEMQSQLYSGLDTGQAGSQTGYANSIASLIGSRNDQAPSIGQYAGLMQGAAAGNMGNGFHMSGSVQGPGGGGMSSDFMKGQGGGSGGASAGGAGGAGGAGAMGAMGGGGLGGGGGSSGGQGFSSGNFGLGGTGGDQSETGIGYFPNGSQDATWNGSGGFDASASSNPTQQGFDMGGLSSAGSGIQRATSPAAAQTSSAGSAGPISSAVGAPSPMSVSQSQARDYSMLWGSNWQQMVNPNGGGVTIT